MAWYNNNWDYRKKLTIDSSKVSGNVSSIPIYIDLADLGSDFFTNAKSDGSDIVITSDDGETKLSRDLVSYDDGAETGEIHFNAPSVSGSTDTDFYIYYGYSSASETNDLSGTWGANTDGVYHLQSDASDSSGNSSDGTVSGATNVTSGKIYSDYSFDGTNDYISTPIAIPAATSGTLASYYGWVYNDGSNNWRIFGSDASSNGKFHLGVWGDNTKVVFSESYYGGAGSDGPDTTVMAVSVGWHHAAIVKTAAYKFDIYFDGVKVVNQANRVATIGTNFNIGRYYNVTYYLGENDEIVVTDDALTADEVNTIYNNQNDTTTFFTVGDEEHGTLETESIEMSETITKTIYKELTESVSLDDDVTLPGIVSSKCVYNNNVNVNSATLTVTYTTKVGTPKLMLSNDNGVTWETVTSGVANVFSSTGTQVKYKIRASSGNIISKIQTQIN